MKLALNLGHLRGAEDRVKFEAVEEADRLGYGTVWVAEAYGSDAVSVLGYLAARTTSIGLGSAVLQIPGRSPAMTAMTAATLDVLSQGRFSLGLGVSGPQVSEGWHGVDFAEPLSRTREYVEVVRMALAREPLSYTGKHHALPRTAKSCWSNAAASAIGCLSGRYLPEEAPNDDARAAARPVTSSHSANELAGLA